MIRKSAAARGLWIALLAAPAHGADGVSLETGRGNDRADLWRIGLQWKWDRKWRTDRRWQVAGYWDLAFGGWTTDQTIYDLGLTPVFRLQERDGPGRYFEAAIGFHLLSEDRISRTRIFSTRFQFGDHVGLGWRLGSRGQHDVGLRLQHLSNGAIARPNPGVNFVQIRLMYHHR